jgi:hypothetical protein
MTMTRFALAAAISLAALTAPAEAGWRKMFFWMDEPAQEPRAVSRAYIFDDEGEVSDEAVIKQRRKGNSLYGQDDYYEPRYEPQKKPAVKTKKAQAAKPLVKDVAKKLAAPAKSVAEKPAAASGISCDKGVDLVGGYGFSGVKPKACAGKLFTYTASRTGKSYEVSVSALNGEITEVRKVQ